MRRVLIIGMDGATYDLIRPWVAEGKLPNLGRLLDRSASGPLHSTVPPMTFPAWNAFMTGKNPGKHGVYDFTERKPGSFEIQIVNAKHRRAKTIWQILSEAGKRVGVVGVPVSYPPDPINGVMISGFDAPVNDASAMYPPELYEELKYNIGGYIISADFVSELTRGRVDEAISAMEMVIERKGMAAQYLLRKEKWDCFMIMFGETDAVVHYYWRFHDPKSPHYEPSRAVSFDPVFRVYKKVDESIGKILALINDETQILVMSDHGTGGGGDKVVHVNRWLEEHSHLVYLASSEKGGIRGIKRKVKDFVFGPFLDDAKSWARAFLPKWVINQLRFSEKRGYGNKIEAMLRFSAIDWLRTKAFSEETPYYPTIWINVKGREPQGIVEPGAEYEAVRNDIIDKLYAWRDPETGERVVKKVYRREEIYHGEYVYKAADLLISWNLDRGYSYLSRPSFKSKTGEAIERVGRRELLNSKFMINRSGSHRDLGVLAAAGPDVRIGASVNGAEITDLAPTLLYVMGLPIPDDMDGRVLLELFSEEYVESHPLRHQKGEEGSQGGEYSYSDEDTERVSERLRGLGYME